MLMKSKYMIFLPTLILGTFLTISSASWYSAWVGLEINLMSLVPILINNNSFFSVEATIKYFLVQALASSVLVLFVMLRSNTQLFNLMQPSEFMFTLMLLLKAGVAPLHFWFPQVIICSEWVQCLLVLSWQKLAPFVMLSYMNNSILYFFVFSSTIIGVMGGLNQTNIKLILTYSSIIHSAWMLSLVSCHEMVWLLYFIIYTILLFSVTYIFIFLNVENLVSFYHLKMNFLQKITLFINTLSLAGLPPFLGFLGKILALLMLVKTQFNLILLSMLILSSLISFYFYFRMMYTSLFVSNSSPLFVNPSNFCKPYLLVVFIVISLMGVMLLPLVFLYF